MAQGAAVVLGSRGSAGARSRSASRRPRRSLSRWVMIVAVFGFCASTTSASQAASPKAGPVERATRSLACAATTCEGVRRRPVCASDGRVYASACEVQRLNRCDGKSLLVVDCASLTTTSTLLPPLPPASPQLPLATLQLRADDRCTPSLKREFASNFLRHARDEFDRSSTGAHALAGLARYEKIVNWKFDNLDLDQNDRLTAAELRQLKKLVKSNLQPKACSRDIVETCDGDVDGDVSREEWAACLRLKYPPSSAAYEDMQADMQVPIVSPRATAPDGMADAEEPHLHAIAPAVVNRRTSAQQLGSNGLSAGDLIVSHQQRRHGQDMEGKRVRSNSDHLVSITARTCADARESALRSQNHGALQKPIPVCQKNGKFQREQCLHPGRACWCVYEDSGSPIPGSVVYDGAAKLNCSEEKPAATSGGTDEDDETAPVVFAETYRRPASQPPSSITPQPRERDRELPGCSNRKHFLAEVVSTFEREMMSTSRSSTFNHAAEAGGWTAAEKALHWKVAQSDRNNDRRLNANEARELVRTLSTGAHSRPNRLPNRCTAGFLAYCDVDGDKHLTYDELADCLELKPLPHHAQDVSQPPPADTEAYDPRPGWPKKTDLPTALDMNPFVYLLVPVRGGGDR